MLGEDFTNFGFKTVWHMTDIDNLQSIALNGLMSRNMLEKIGIQFEKVGAEHIVNTRADFKKYALTFVTPHNKFIRGRFDYHFTYHPNSNGLALIEIDLRDAYDTRRGGCYITDGNLAAKRTEIQIGPLTDFVKILNWHSILDRHESGSAYKEIHEQAEVLFSRMIDKPAIRRFWVGSPEDASRIQSLETHVPIEVANGFFESKGVSSLPWPAEHNFANIKRLPPTPIMNKKFGRGTLVCNLGGYCVANYEKQGLQLIRFGDYDWLD
jgi:hypothetical protein